MPSKILDIVVFDSGVVGVIIIRDCVVKVLEFGVECLIILAPTKIDKMVKRF